MSDSVDLRQAIAVLQDRMSRLSAASLRISESLDLHTVLREVADSARALTGAASAAIVTMDKAGRLQDFVTSGLSPEEHQRLVDLPQGQNVWKYLLRIQQPMRFGDLPAYLRARGFPGDSVLPRTCLSGHIRHRGVHLGSLYVGDKEGGEEFTDADEEILVLFASQAATAIANARTYRDERRARADLEALVETSPVGVVVFNARTGDPVSFNREARRILESLRQPGRPPEELQRVISYRRADGREVSLAEVPLAQQLSSLETVRAEEMVVSVPDGRSVKLLINATPLLGEDDAVESVVATMQDLAPLEALERSRVEFLGLVSHELRAPLLSIKGAAATVMNAASTPDAVELREVFRIVDEQADHMRSLIGDLLDAGRIEAGTLSVAPEPVDVADLVDRARSTFLSGGGRHTVAIDLPLDLPRVLADRQRIVQVLNNLFANASRYAPESSPIQVSAAPDGEHVAISVADRGRGVPPERLPHLFRKHARVDGEGGISGTGLGLAICKGLVETHGGRIWAESGGAGLGTRVTFTLPVAREPAASPVPSRVGPAGGAQEPVRILVVDDDPRTLGDVRKTLTEAGYAPLVTADPQQVPRLLKKKKPRLVLLDLMLPDADGIELMESVPGLADLPVIFLSVFGRDETIARALEVGATDYIVKPFSPTELTARVRAALRRYAESEAFRLGALDIDFRRRRVTVDGQVVKLTATEYELLRVLALNAGQVVTHDELLRQVWNRRRTRDSSPVRDFVKKLRRKLGDDPADPAYIAAVPRVGYRMPPPGD